MQGSFYHMGLNRHLTCYFGVKHDFAAIRKHDIVKDLTALYEPRCEKTGLRGFRPGQTTTGLYSHRRWLET